MLSGLPAGNFDVVSVATPFTSLAEPSPVVPFWKTTVPVGTGPEAEVTVAVKVTASPTADGFRLDVKVVVVAVFKTVWATTAELPAVVALPVYVAVMFCEAPACKVDVVKLATPLLSTIRVCSISAPMCSRYAA